MASMLYKREQCNGAPSGHHEDGRLYGRLVRVAEIESLAWVWFDFLLIALILVQRVDKGCGSPSEYCEVWNMSG